MLYELVEGAPSNVTFQPEGGLVHLMLHWYDG